MRKLGVTIILVFITFFVFSQSITLSLSNDDEDGLIPLEWDIAPISQPFDSVEIYFQTSSMSAFERLTTFRIPISTYVDSVHCEETVLYEARLYNNGMLIATSGSFPDSPIAEIDPIPQPPILYRLSYENGGIRAEWNQSDDATFTAYTVMKKNVAYTAVENIPDIADTSILITNLVSPCTEKDELLLITKDHCQSEGTTNLTEDYLQSLTLITDLTHDLCTNSIRITFEEYKTSAAIGQTITGHEIWVAENGGSPIKVAQISAPASSYTHENIANGSRYEYFIITLLGVEGQEYKSQCCPKSIDTEEIPRPDYLTIENISVTNPHEITLDISSDPTPILHGYRIYRSTDDLNYQIVSETEQPTASNWQYIDNTADTDNQSYYYKVVALTICDQESDTSDNTARSIHLSIESEGITNTLWWNRFQGWEADEYQLLRYAPETDMPTLIETFPIYYSTAYTDTPPMISLGQWRYRAVAYNTATNKMSYSNMVTANQNTFFQMPNAFRPEGVTAYVFKPVFYNLPPENYQIFIYNRWGQNIYQSSNATEGWDGRYKGELVQAGSYVYVIQYNDNNNQLQSVKGSVIVVR